MILENVYHAFNNSGFVKTDISEKTFKATPGEQENPLAEQRMLKADRRKGILGRR